MKQKNINTVVDFLLLGKKLLLLAIIKHM